MFVRSVQFTYLFPAIYIHTQPLGAFPTLPLLSMSIWLTDPRWFFFLLRGRLRCDNIPIAVSPTNPLMCSVNAMRFRVFGFVRGCARCLVCQM